LVTGRRFVQFLAQEHLKDMIREASITLGSLTGQRYALELSDDLEFVVRDDFNGGERRSVSTLSGGETFLTSLALALALSSNIQLKGKYPLGFFFLDEGFGTLDSTKLDLVMDALERIRDKERMVGVISHVKELKDRLPTYLEVIPAADDGTGSQIKVVGAKK
ncbi:MAG TPA: SbcC/MukB-like Walker B domain-containing protein, partial [Bacillota bacterium]|nr:SbcC/MukB-like Walker B domain-containing protein [Bacillota bacterium]